MSLLANHNLIVLLGITASGKTSLAVKLAKDLNAEIISADSRQVYRGLDIGSGKDLHEYEDVPYHLIDIVDPGYEFSVFDFQQCFYTAFSDIQQRDKLPFLVGGSALYIDSILDGYQMLKVDKNPLLRKQLENDNIEVLTARLIKLKPKQHNTTDLLDRERLIRAIEIADAENKHHNEPNNLPEIKPLILAIKWQREIIRQRITLRLKERLEHGLIDEVQLLHKQGISWETLEFYGLEYRFVAQYLQNKLSHNDMYQRLNSAIHQFAKKQDTWLRRIERKGHQIHWLDGNDDLYSQAMNII